MPTKLVEGLKDKKVHVEFRGCENLHRRYGIMHLGHTDLDEPSGEHEKGQRPHAICIDVHFNTQEEKKTAEALEKAKEAGKKGAPQNADNEIKVKDKLKIPVHNVHDVKARDYREGFAEHHALHVVLQNAESKIEPMKVKQVIFFFQLVEDRDNWFDGLQSLCDRRWAEEVPQTENKLHLIKKITELVPEKDEMIKFEVLIQEQKKPEVFTVMKSQVKDKNLGSEVIKELVKDFVLHNFILPAEGVSLYRYARALISRLRMEEVVEEITKEVDKLRWNPYEIAKLHPQEIRKKEKQDSERLSNLKNALPERIGRHGAGSPLIIKILERSIEKTKQYNLYHRHSILGSRGMDNIEDNAGDDA